MTTYKEIKGTNIEVLESDPSNPLDGQVWFNSTDNVLRGNVGTPVVAWSTVNSLNQARTSTSGAGIATAALVVGGYSTTNIADTESWNGSNWTEVNNLNTARTQLGGAGTSTSALAFGGEGASPSDKTTATESWNGTSWTNTTDMTGSARYRMGDAGANNTSALAFGGNPGNVATTLEWNTGVAVGAWSRS